MRRGPGGTSRRHLRMLFSMGVGAGLTDGQLLERFATERGEGEAAEMAFAALVERHGPMVLRACRAVLRDDHEAQDAFQATFLILARKSRTLWVRDSLGPWLHRVACRVAGRARTLAGRRRLLERRAAEQAAEPSTEPGHLGREFAAILHEEVNRLPDRYRVPVVLCDLDGRSYEDAARHLGCPLGTVKSRLARGRERLRARLIRRGVAPSILMPGAGLTLDTAPAAIPDTLTRTTIEAATRTAAGVSAAGVVPAAVLELTEGVLTMMLGKNLKLLASGVLVAVGLAIGAGALAQQAAKDHPPDPPAPNAVKPPSRTRPPDGDRRWTRTLPGGATIEVVGISTYPASPGSWWGPDGKPLTQPPCNGLVKADFPSDKNVILRAIVARTTGLPPGAVPGSGWSVREVNGGSVGSPAHRDAKEVPNTRLIVAEFPRDIATCTVEFSVADGPWKTIETFDGKGMQAGSSPDGPSFIFGEAIETRTGTAVTVMHTLKDVDVRLVAVDRDGKEHPSLPGFSGGASVNGISQLTARFDLDPKEIRKFRLQTCPYERAEIPGIPLNPNSAG